MAEASTVCECTNPGKKGDEGYGKNGYTCSDNDDGYCGLKQRCFEEEPFKKEKLSEACKIGCECYYPGSNTTNENGYKCDDGTRGWCSGDQICYPEEAFAKDKATEACNDCSCTNPGKWIYGQNGYTCRDGTNAHCGWDKVCSMQSIWRDATEACKVGCSCTSVGTNGIYTCSDGTTAYCGDSERCFLDLFDKENVAEACKIGCSCDNPGIDKTKNGYTCDDDDGEKAHCAGDEICNLKYFAKTDVQKACNKCWCTNPGKWKNGQNGYKCTNDTEAHCSETQMCLLESFDIASEACRIGCSCNNAGSKGDGQNGYSCSDDSSGYCGSSEICYLESFDKEKVTEACRKESVIAAALYDAKDFLPSQYNDRIWPYHITPGTGTHFGTPGYIEQLDTSWDLRQNDRVSSVTVAPGCFFAGYGKEHMKQHLFSIDNVKGSETATKNLDENDDNKMTSLRFFCSKVCVKLYRDGDWKGDDVLFMPEGSMEDMARYEWDNMVTGIKVTDGCTLISYSGTYFRESDNEKCKECHWPLYTSTSFDNLHKNYNDKISSLKCTCS